MRFPWNKSNIKKISYPDGSSYVKVESFLPQIEFRINSYEDLWTLTQIKDVYDYNGKPLSVTIPCLLDVQADRRFEKNQSHNLKLVLYQLARLNFENITIFHPHNPEVVEAILGDRVEIIDNSEFIDLVLAKGLMGEYTSETETQWDKILESNLILMSSDAGGFKPLMKLADKIQWKGETFSASKSRKYEDGKSVLTQQIDRQDFGGKDILIIDDICVKGGTFVGLAKMLKERNAGKLYLAISHLTVPNPNPELVDLYDTIFTTNSKGIGYNVSPIEILPYRDININF